jgi:hypothetical protein
MIWQSPRILAAALAVTVVPLAGAESEHNANSAKNRTEEAAPANSTATAPAGTIIGNDPLLWLMHTQGVLGANDVKALATAPSAELRDRLLLLLRTKNKSAFQKPTSIS